MTSRSFILRLAFALAGLAISPTYAAVINVPSGGDFQAALNAANPGDTIVLQAGADYPTSGGFTLPNKGSSTQIITIESSQLSTLPADGYRVRPADAAKMPRLLSLINATPVVQAAAGAHHYRFRGIEFALAPGHWSYVMVQLGEGTETSLAQQPHDISLERCYIHGDPSVTPGTKRGVALEGASMAVRDSYISNIHVTGQDSQAIASFNGPGPYQIINNYLEGAGENVLFGGADPKIQNLVPSDIEVRNNHFFKPLSWHTTDPSYAGIHWSVKNIFELKNAQRVVVDGNIFENCWPDGQTGIAILFTPRNQDGTCPWCVIKDVSFTRNIIRGTAAGVNILNSDNLQPSQPTQNILIRDLVIENVNSAVYGGDGRLFQMVSEPDPATNIRIDHVTALHEGGGNSFISLGDANTFADQWGFTNSIVTYGNYGLHTPRGEGTAGLNAFVTNYQFAGNVIVGGGRASTYPPGNFFANSTSAVGFRDLAGRDYHLTAASPYKNAGTDGKDIGADLDEVYGATCGVVTGVPMSSCSSVGLPPPPSTPPPTPFTPINVAPTDLDQVRVYPNPWRSDRASQKAITFDGLTDRAEVKLYTLSGRWIKSLPKSDSSVTWDLTNRSGNPVASGLYLYVIENASGAKRRGKLVIVR